MIASLPATDARGDGSAHDDPGSANTPACPRRSGPTAAPGAVAALLLSMYAGLLAWAAPCHAPSIDEVGHMAAGLAQWRLGRSDLYRVNPPLVRLIATLPVALANPEPDWIRGAPLSGRGRLEFLLGDRFVATYGPSSIRYFAMARWACIPLALAGGWVAYRWASDIGGPAAGLVALALWCSCPNLLANAQMITPDAPAAAVGLWASYAFWRWARRPGWGTAGCAGIGFGLALLTKTTWLVLAAVWPFLFVLRAVSAPWRRSVGALVVRTAQLASMFAVAIYVLDLGYLFEGTFRPLRDFAFTSEALGGVGHPGDRATRGINRYATPPWGALPVPFPAEWVHGIDDQKREFEVGLPAYLGGRWYRSGFWYYYLYAVMVKTPLGTLALAALAVLCGRRSGPGDVFNWWSLLLPPAALFALVSSQTGINAHFRYLLPAIPFIYVAIAVAVAGLTSLATRNLAIVALTMSAASSLAVYPHSHAYFHELVGGPQGGRHHLIDSNLDWGQDLTYLRLWLDRHATARPLGLAYYGGFDPRDIGIAYQLPPREGIEGGENGLAPEWFAISASLLQGLRTSIPTGRGGREVVESGCFTYFQRYCPVDVIGGSIYVYHIPSIKNYGRGGLRTSPGMSKNP